MKYKYWIPGLGLRFCINDHPCPDLLTVITATLVSWGIPIIILINLIFWLIS